MDSSIADKPVQAELVLALVPVPAVVDYSQPVP
jgi:hypothetical protein